MKFRSAGDNPIFAEQPTVNQVKVIAPQRLRSPFWRIVILTAMVSPLAIAVWVERGGRSFPFPPCLFQWAFGFPAPSCGLTR